jgi:outer membrane protein assembly factor BamB
VGSHILADILVVDGTMYIPFQAGGVTAMTIADYKEIWSYPTEEGVWSKPLLVNNMIVISSLDHHLYAVDKDTGELQWKLDLEGGVASTPLLANDRLYVGSYNKKLFEISLDGKILNTYETQNWVWGTPAIDENGIVYVADLSGYVHAVDSQNNLSEVWSKQIATRGIRSGPLVYGDNVIVAARDGFVYWIDRRDGVTLTDKEIEGKPELLSDILLVEPSESLKIDEPLIIVSTVNTGELLVAFQVDGRQSWVYGR